MRLADQPTLLLTRAGMVPSWYSSLEIFEHLCAHKHKFDHAHVTLLRGLKERAKSYAPLRGTAPLEVGRCSRRLLLALLSNRLTNLPLPSRWWCSRRLLLANSLTHSLTHSLTPSLTS